MKEIILLIVAIGLSTYFKDKKRKKSTENSKQVVKNTTAKKTLTKKKKSKKKANSDKYKQNTMKKAEEIKIEVKEDERLKENDELKVEILSEYKDEMLKNPKKAFVLSEIFNRKY